MYDPTVPERNRRARNTVLLSAALLFAVAAVGVFLAFRFVAAERERDLAGWQVRLGIVADSRAAAVDEWLDQQFGVMRELAENASLQIYLTEMALAQGDATKVTDVEAQTAYLRNLVTATADTAAYDVRFTGSNVAITSAVTFANTGSVTLGDAATDDLHFAGGVSTAAASAAD